MIFEDLFKQIQDLLYQLKTECFSLSFFQKSVSQSTHCIVKQAFLFEVLTMKYNQREIALEDFILDKNLVSQSLTALSH